MKVKNKKNKLIIIGASGHGKVVADVAYRMNVWEKIYFFDDNSNRTTLLGYPIKGVIKDAWNFVDCSEFIVAIGDNLIRQTIQKKLKEKGASLATLIHPASVIGKEVEIGEGSVIMPGAIINSGSTIGTGCIVNTNASIDHDNILDEFVHISPNVSLAGTVYVGSRTWFGIGSTAINNIWIDSDCNIGAGAVVINNLKEPGTYIGVPARRA